MKIEDDDGPESFNSPPSLLHFRWLVCYLLDEWQLIKLISSVNKSHWKIIPFTLVN